MAEVAESPAREAAPLRLGVHPDRPERLALIRQDGTAVAWFAVDRTVAEVVAHLRERGVEFVVDEGVG